MWCHIKRFDKEPDCGEGGYNGAAVSENFIADNAYIATYEKQRRWLSGYLKTTLGGSSSFKISTWNGWI